MMDEDKINHPSHYTQGGIECWDAIKAQLTYEEWLGYLRGNVVKYLWRFRDKNGKEDLQKAQVYLEKLIKEYSYKYSSTGSQLEE